MRVICLNGWGGKLHGALVAWLAEAAPDVLCLQEVVHTPAAPRPWLTYRDGDHVLDQRADFLGDIQRALPGHDGTFCPAARGVLWDGDAAVPSLWGLATFLRRGVPVIGQVQGFVHGAWSADGYGDHPRSRTAHGVRLWDDGLGRAVSVLHMHGLRDLGGKGDTPARAAQARRLAEMAGGLARPGDALVVCGDFNVEPGSETFDILGALGLSDLVTGRGFAGTRTAEYAKPGRFADYMLVTPGTPVGAFDLVRDPVVSDHCPLVLDLGDAPAEDG
ncbi:MAG: endonuclease/exonuclease/phosphatase family protein [Pseudomonadota bacterium]